MRALLLVGPFLLFASLCTCIGYANDKLEIRLGVDSVRDPLLQFVFPPKGSKDELRFDASGIIVNQPADPGPREAGAAGFKVGTSVRGDFLFELDLECRTLEQPKSGWGHGLFARFKFSDLSLISVGCISTPRFKKAFRVSVEMQDGEGPRLQTSTCSFNKGRWQVKREGDELIISVEEQGVSQEVARLACTTDELMEIQVWATRLPKDNGESTFLLKKVGLSGDEFFARSELTRTKEGKWTPFWVALATTFVLVAIYVLRTRR